MPHIHTLRPQPLFRQTVRPLGAALNLNGNNLFPIHNLCVIADKHCDIRLDAVTHHVGNLLYYCIRIINAHNATIISNSYIQRSARTVRKGYDFLLYILHNNFFQFKGFTFLKSHIIISLKSFYSHSNASNHSRQHKWLEATRTEKNGENMTFSLKCDKNHTRIKKSYLVKFSKTR